ncbi:hypothetical protein SEA_DALANDE_109 [Gordonia phage DalanDe]|nr:hypothetical protein SEA_DALANDE_109 [Gordonia phage DalanDe]
MSWLWLRTNRLVVRLLQRILMNQRAASRDLDALRKQVNRIERKVDAVMATNADIQEQVNELNAAVAVINSGVGTIKSDLATARDKISELESAGVAPETLAGLKAAVDNVETIASQFEVAVSPDEPTPAPEDLPGPVEETPAEPAPEPEAPAEPTTDEPTA